MIHPSTAELAYQTVYRMIAKERAMREHVFRNDPAKMALKTTECDDALGSLEILRSATTPAPTVHTPYRQDGLL